MALQHFFDWQGEGVRLPLLDWMDPWLILVSVLIAVLMSMMALHIAAVARRSRSRLVRACALATGALSMGGGIWAMHFVGMLAFAPCAANGFSPTITMLSAMPALAASLMAWGVLMRRDISRARLMVSATLMGVGIGLMHFSGMAASELQGVIRYAPLGVALAVGVSVVLSYAALSVRFRLRQWQLPGWAITPVAGLVMGCSVAGMHYTAMGAMRFTVPATQLAASGGDEHPWLVAGIVGTTLALGLLVLLFNAGMAWRQLYLDAQRNETRLRAVLDTAADAVVMVDASGLVHSVNGAAVRLLGWASEDIVGRSVGLLMPEPYRSAPPRVLARYLARYLADDQAGTADTGRELEVRHRDDRPLPVRLAVGRAQTPQQFLFVGFLADISQRRRIEHSLRASDELLRSMVSNLPGVCFRRSGDPTFSPIFMSAAVRAMTGWGSEDFLARRVTFCDLIEPQDREAYHAAMAQALKLHCPYFHEYRLRDAQGRLRWVSETGRGVFDERQQLQWVDAVIMDHTDIQTRDAEYAGTLEAIDRSMGWVEYDLDGTVRRANEIYLRIFGYRQEDIVGRKHAMFCPPELVRSAAYGQMWRDLAEGRLVGGEFLRLDSQGREVWVEGHYNPILDIDGRPYKVVKLVADVTARKRMEAELRLAKEQAEAAAVARTAFLANMSHEIRTPMNAIIGFTEELQNTPLNPNQARYMGTVHYAARSLLRLLNDILDTAKLDRGAVTLEPAAFSVRELCRQALASLGIAAAKKELALDLHLDDSLPDHLMGDALRVQQILVNLVGNAIKFTAEGSVALRASYDNGQLHLRIEDSGIGIAPEHLGRIFDAFAQADASTTRRYGGTGLGTTISRQLAQLMGGGIEVSSTQGVGSLFHVWLPMAPADAPLPREAAPRRDLPTLDVLVVDDVEDNIELMRLNMERLGHRVQVARNGAQAVATCQAHAFGLVLMDVQMPVMDGLEAVRRIRALERQHGRPPVPVIALSASVMEHDRTAATSAGMDGFCGKPLDLDRLLDEIARVLDVQQRIRADAPPPVPLQDGDGSQVAAAPVDWDAGARLWGGGANHAQAVRRFLRQRGGLPDQWQRLLAQGDAEALGQAAHALRGAAGNLGLRPLQTQATQLEELARRGDLPGCETALQSLAAQLQAVAQALEADDAAGAGPGDTAAQLAALDAAAREEARAALQALGQAVAQLELDEAALSRLQQQLPRQALTLLQTALDRFDFDQAAAQVAMLQAALDAAARQGADHALQG